MTYSFKGNYDFKKLVVKDISEQIDKNNKPYWVIDTSDHEITLFCNDKKMVDKLKIDEEYGFEYKISQVGNKTYNWITLV